MKIMFSLDGFQPLSTGVPSPLPNAEAGTSKLYGPVWTLEINTLDELGALALELEPPEIGMEEGHFTVCLIEVNVDDLWCVTFGWHSLGEDPEDDDDDGSGGDLEWLLGNDTESANPSVTVPAARIEAVPADGVLADMQTRAERAILGAVGVPSSHWEHDTDA